MRYLISIMLFTNGLLYAQVFDGAVGWGANWTWPASYEVYVITNSNNSGTGSLRDAVESTITTDGRIIVFNGFSGWVDVTSGSDGIVFSQNKKLYIAGQTSENGIGLRLGGSHSSEVMVINNGSVIMRGTTIAAGVPNTVDYCCGDALAVRGGINHVFDRSTIMWGSDGSFDWINATESTIQYSLIAETLSIPTGWSADHSKGQLISNNADKITLFRNGYPHNRDRNPLWGGGSPGGPLDELELVQNVMYNWDNFGFVCDNAASINIINNVSIRGNDTSGSRYAWAFDEGESTIYSRDNYDDVHRTSSGADDWDMVGCHNGCGTYMADPLPKSGNQTLTAHDYPLKDQAELTRQQVIDTVTTHSGDWNDAGGMTTRIRNSIINETGNYINNPSDVGGYPSISAGTIIDDADSDGIPDSEEATWGDDTFGYVNSIISGASGGGGEPTPPALNRVRPWNIRSGSGSGVLYINGQRVN